MGQDLTFFLEVDVNVGWVRSMSMSPLLAAPSNSSQGSENQHLLANLLGIKTPNWVPRYRELVLFVYCVTWTLPCDIHLNPVTRIMKMLLMQSFT